MMIFCAEMAALENGAAAFALMPALSGIITAL